MEKIVPLSPSVPELEPVDPVNSDVKRLQRAAYQDPMAFDNSVESASIRLLGMLQNSAANNPRFVSSTPVNQSQYFQGRRFNLPHKDALSLYNQPMPAASSPSYPHLHSSFDTPNRFLPPISPQSYTNSNASSDLLRLIQTVKSPKRVPFMPHNAFSVDPITGGMIQPIARDLIPQGLAINRIPPGMWSCIKQTSNLNMNEDEEAYGLSGFDRILYTRSEIARRVNCEEYRLMCKDKTFDLNITMPIQIPYGNVVVDVNSGEHYYGIVGEKSSADHPHSDHTLFGRGLPDVRTQSYKDPEGVDVDVPDFTASHHPSACDMWSSFLQIKLGVVYNVRQEQMRIVVEALKMSLSGAQFDKPIEFTANGIYGNGHDGVLKSPPRLSKDVKYVTHLKPKTALDQERYIMIRQRIKMFAKSLGFHFGGSLGGANLNGIVDCQPLICVELDTNLTHQRITNGLIQCPIRSYHTRGDSDMSAVLKNLIWTPVNTDSGQEDLIYKNATKDHILSKVESSEIRLEHDRGYGVDPRWPRDLIIARKIASHDVGSGIKDSHSTERLARHEFSMFKNLQHIIYRGKFKDLAPNETRVSTSELKLSGDTVRGKLCQSRFKKEFSSYLRFEPLAGSCAPADEETQSPATAPLPKPYNPNLVSYISAPVKGKQSGNNKRVPWWNVNASEFKPTATTKPKNNGSPKKKVKGKKANVSNNGTPRQERKIEVDVNC